MSAVEKLWCSMCGKWSDHQSGSCPELHSTHSLQRPCSDAPDFARNDCEACDGKGWYATGNTDNAIQLQCQFCYGTGVRPVQPNSVVGANSVEVLTPEMERKDKFAR